MSWSYSNQAAWGGSCNLTGSGAFQQSPIDFNTMGQNGVPPVAGTALAVTIVNVNGDLGQWDAHDNNVAFSTQLSMAPQSSPTVLSGPTNITVLGFHFHCPPEHKLLNSSLSVTGAPDFAVHIKALASFNVNGTPQTQLVVFAIAGYWKETLDGGNPALDSFVSSYVAPTMGLGGTFNANALPGLVNAFNSWPFLTYVGSLTTPPCSGQVLWFVLDYPFPYTSAQWTTNPATFSPIQTALSNLAPEGQSLFPNNRVLQPILTSTQVYQCAPNQPPGT